LKGAGEKCVTEGGGGSIGAQWRWRGVPAGDHDLDAAAPDGAAVT
jgi:hypothetical protein